MRGAFITFEGCEGSGKSTQIRLLSQYLQDKISRTSSPPPETGRRRDLRRNTKIILNGKFMEMSDECEALLYAAARVQHLKDTVEPALERGEMVAAIGVSSLLSPIRATEGGCRSIFWKRSTNTPSAIICPT